MTEELQIQVICTREIDGKTGITEGIENVWNDDLFFDIDTEDLAFAIDANDTTRCLDGLPGNAGHVNADPGFEIVEMNEVVPCDEEDDAVTSRDLHCNREIVGRFGREEDIDCFLFKRRVVGIMVNLDDI